MATCKEVGARLQRLSEDMAVHVIILVNHDWPYLAAAKCRVSAPDRVAGETAEHTLRVPADDHHLIARLAAAGYNVI